MKQKEQEEKELYSGFWGSIKYFLQAPISSDEFSLDERRKVPVYLEISLNNLKDMFGIHDEVIKLDTVWFYIENCGIFSDFGTGSRTVIHIKRARVRNV